MECCPRKLHSLATAWASHIVAVLTHFRLSPYPRPPSGRHCIAKSGQFGGGDLRQYLHRSGYQIAEETSPRFDQGGRKRRTIRIAICPGSAPRDFRADGSFKNRI